jgi:hypothetical protein
LLGLEHLLYNLLFFDEEGPHNPVSHTASASGTTVCPSDGLLGLGYMLAAHATGFLDTEEQHTTVTAPGSKSKRLNRTDECALVLCSYETRCQHHDI